MKVMNVKNNLANALGYSFHGLNSQDFDEMAKNQQKYKKDLQVQLEMLARVGSDFERRSEINKKIEELSNQFRTINEMYNSVISSNDPKTFEIISDWLEKRNKINRETGFNKIFGLDDIKTRLDNEFVLKTMLKAQIADNATSQNLKQNVVVPNAMLFFGPPGCGKSFFATALAEQALTNRYRVDASMLDKNNVFIKILECAQDSKNNYFNSHNKQRSIIVVDEINSLVRQDSPVLNQFKEFIKDCSDKYKCTLFLTSNSPLDIDKEILSNISTKIPVPPPDKQVISQYLTSKLAQINVYDKNNIERVAENLCKNPEQRYSFRLIDRILKKGIQSGENSIFATMNNLIIKEEIKPSIKLSDIELFQNAKRLLT